MEKITVFKTKAKVEEISKFLSSIDKPQVCIKNHSMIEMHSPKGLAEAVKNYGNHYVVYGKRKIVWMHKHPEVMAKLLLAHAIPFTVKYVVVESQFKKE